MAIKGLVNSRVPSLIAELVLKVTQPTDLQRFTEQLRRVKRSPSHAGSLVPVSVESEEAALAWGPGWSWSLCSPLSGMVASMSHLLCLSFLALAGFDFLKITLGGLHNRYLFLIVQEAGKFEVQCLVRISFCFQDFCYILTRLRERERERERENASALWSLCPYKVMDLITSQGPHLQTPAS